MTMISRDLVIIKLQIVSLGPYRNMLELVDSGLYVAGWNDDIDVVGAYL